MESNRKVQEIARVHWSLDQSLQRLLAEDRAHLTNGRRAVSGISMTT
ncbi:MAG: hypothetical protein WCD86_05845 [Ktedonobacteraceae bacterium]